eukprot:13470630-Alexandrium_andersonii.AAC.1
MDDRSIRAPRTRPLPRPSGRRRSLPPRPLPLPPALGRALEVTADFDSKVGLRENLGKRQLWVQGVEVEHLGLRLL